MQLWISVAIFIVGWALEGIMALLVLLSLGPIRRAFFELFYHSHWLLFVLCAVVAAVHGASATLVGTALWAIDVLVRTWYMAGRLLLRTPQWEPYIKTYVRNSILNPTVGTLH